MFRKAGTARSKTNAIIVDVFLGTNNTITERNIKRIGFDMKNTVTATSKLTFSPHKH